jgi:hypothetical protein
MLLTTKIAVIEFGRFKALVAPVGRKRTTSLASAGRAILLRLAESYRPNLAPCGDGVPRVAATSERQRPTGDPGNGPTGRHRPAAWHWKSSLKPVLEFEMGSSNSIRIRSERPRLFEAFGVGVVMVRANLHILRLRILDLALNPALQ